VDGDGPGHGARFIGTNTHPAIGTWDVPCFVDRFEPEAVFGWVTPNPAHPGARWTLETIAVDPTSTRLRHSLVLGPGPSGLTAALERFPDKEHTVLERRVDEHAANMARVVLGIAAAAEERRGA